MAEAQQTNQTQSNAQGPSFSIEKIYLKDSSYEAPRTPEQFKQKWEPKIHCDIKTKADKLEEPFHEVELTVTITAKNDDAPAYIVESKYAGIFSLRDIKSEQIGELLGSFCPSLLYPYVSQHIGDVVQKGGFPQLNLTPINFDALYREQLKRQQEKNEGAAAEGTASN